MTNSNPSDLLLFVSGTRDNLRNGAETRPVLLQLQTHMATQKQTMIQAQPASAEAIATLGKTYGGKSKSRDFMPLTQWETLAALLAFFEDYRWQDTGDVETDAETGEETPVLLDCFKPYADAILAARMETSRASAAKDLTALKASLRAELESLGMSGEKLESVLAKYGAA